MLGIIGKILISLSFVSSLGALIYYFRNAQNGNLNHLKIGNWLFGVQGITLFIASLLLVYLTFTHQFQYYYVWNYSSLDLSPKYLWSSFYGGQEGSFMLWIFFSFLVGLGIMKWTRDPYKAPVMFFFTFTQVFLLSMLLGWSFGDINIGASPFRTIAQEMPDAPFLRNNPDFVPADGTGLNDLLKSPWMMIHPPLLFVGFAMMTVPYCFAMAALWKRRYNDWVGPALPWTLSANVALLTAIFLGGYWAYETLSFGGFWAWDPVENASLVPWLIGTAGIHTMIIQRKSAVAQKSSILFAILAYVMIVYETFLTRSGILADSSVHSFVDLGLYNQLLIFMIAVTGVGLGMFAYRYKELPTKDGESPFLSREFMTFTGAVLLLVLGLVIIIGTSSPIIGLLFNENPTPPEISFYNNWSMPIAIIMAIFTVLGQYLFWKKYTWETLSSALIWPLVVTSVLTTASIIFGDIKNPYYMLYMFAAFFTVVGNSWVMVRLSFKKPKLIGGSVTHVGFGVLLIGVLISSAYNEPMLDQATENYNAAVLRGEVKDEQGFTLREPINLLNLNLNVPTVINSEYLVTYEGYDMTGQERAGQQTYRLKFESLNSNKAFYMYPEIYPMLATSSANNIQWSVDPDVRPGIFEDIYVYVAGSAHVSRKNDQAKNSGLLQPASDLQSEKSEVPVLQTITFAKGETIEVGSFAFTFNEYTMADTTNLPPNTNIGVRANVEVLHLASDEKFIIEPLFALYNEEGTTYIFSPPVKLPGHDISFKFTKVKPETGEIDLEIEGLTEEYLDEWVLIVAEKKPLISVVWLGTFLLMIGFSVSILRHWDRERKMS